MYSGLAISNRSGNYLGVHQKFDRVAYRHLRRLLSDGEKSLFFPPLDLILHFEGRNGPDGLKIKGPGRNEPYHFYNPHDCRQTDLLQHLEHHFGELCEALKKRDREQAAFQAAWLAHVIVDGLTPAHHYPYAEEIYLLGGRAPEEQTKISDKLLIKRQPVLSNLNLVKLVDNNWRLWGGKGLILTHGLFELGVALIIKPFSFRKIDLSRIKVNRYDQENLVKKFRYLAAEISKQEMYYHFYLWGWTPKLTLKVKNFLAPMVIKFIVLAWYAAMKEAGVVARQPSPQLQNSPL